MSNPVHRDTTITSPLSLEELRLFMTDEEIENVIILFDLPGTDDND